MSTKTIRSDIHRPSVINPDDYEYVAIEYLKIEGIGDCMVLQEERKAVERHMARTGGTYSQHQHGGNCHICGAHAQYTVLFYHRPTNSYVRTGNDCAAKLDSGHEGAFQRVKDAVHAARESKAGKLKAQGVLAEAGLTRCYEIFAEHDQDKLLAQDLLVQLPGGTLANTREYTVICEIVGKLVKYGNISEAQVKFLGKLLNDVSTRKEREAARAAEKALAADCPTGRITVAVEVLKVEERDSDFGTQVKMTVKAEGGYILWGTVPSDLQQVPGDGEFCRPLQRGDKIKLTATVTPSDRDKKFGFFKRPIGTLIQEQELVTA